MTDAWLRCSACRRDIGFKAVHWLCSVSTCNRKRMGLVFCSVSCWDSHVATLRHRDAWAVEARAPSREEWQREQALEAAAPAPPRPAAPLAAGSRPPGSTPTPMVRPAAPAPMVRPAAPTSTSSSSSSAPEARRVVVAASGPSPAPTATAAPTLSDAVDRDILVVVSKLKKYIKDRSGMNTADSVAEVISDHVRAICDDAIRAAATDDRKTVLDRDLPRLPRR